MPTSQGKQRDLHALVVVGSLVLTVLAGAVLSNLFAVSLSS